MSVTPASPSRIRLYNPHCLTDEEVIQTFVARQELFESILADVVGSRLRSAPQHHLIVGQRGMGKTTLLHRIAAELRAEPHRAAFMPLTFPEEQYVEVDRVSKFWLNCLDSLADALEREEEHETVRKIDEVVGKLETLNVDETTFEEECRDAFDGVWRNLKRRPVLFIDNFNLLLGRCSDKDHMLRGYFTRSGSPVLVAASAVYPQQTEDYGAAFYDGFKPHYLGPLDLGEIREMLVKLAHALGRPEVANRVYQHQAKLAALRDLTGGIPRTAVLLFELFAAGFSEDTFEDLESLLDSVTPSYQSRLEQLSDQGKTIVGVLARHWAPIAKRRIGEIAKIPDGSISPQLGRLRDVGFVEEVALYGTSRTGYQIAERFFNIWYLMRFTTRRQRAGLSSLARFLESFHSRAERMERANRMLLREKWDCGTIQYAMALADTLTEDEAIARKLEWKTQLELVEQMEGVRARIAEILDPSEIDERVFEFAELKRRLIEIVPEEAGIEPEEFMKLVLGSPSMIQGSLRKFPFDVSRQTIASAKLSRGQLTGLVDALKDEQRELGMGYSVDAFEWLSGELLNGTLREWGNKNEVEDLVCGATSHDEARLVWVLASQNALKSLSDATRAHMTNLLGCRPCVEASSDDWAFWGHLLRDDFGRYEEAEQAFRRAIELDPKCNWAWIELGKLLQFHMGRYNDAEEAYRKAVAIDPGSAASWNNLGNLLQHYLSRYEEADQAYRQAIQADSSAAAPNYNRGQLLRDHLGRYEDAEQAYRKAIELDPKSVWPWCEFGRLLQDHLGRYEEALLAYRKAIEIDPEAAEPWNAIGNLLTDYLGEFEQAVQHFRTAIKLDPALDSPRHNLAFLLRDHLGNPAAVHGVLAELRNRDNWRDTQHLHAALFAAYEDDWGIVTAELKSALGEIDGELPSDTRDDWFRASAVLLHLGYGPKLVEFLETENMSVKMMPWFEALRAHVEGDRRYLQNIPSEARPAAEKIFDEIAIRRKHLPEKTRRG